MNRTIRHLRANVIAYVALFVALGGTSYAAFVLPANSVGTKQIRNHSITPIKLDPGKIAASVRAWAVIQDGTKVVASKPRARIVDWDPSSAVGDVSWGRAISRSCFPLTGGGSEFVQAALLPGTHGVPTIHFGIFNNAGQPDPTGVLTVIAVFCPGP